MRSDEKLTITFWIYGLFDTCENGIVHDCDRRIKEAVDRGFNCIRMESGAGLFAKPDGTPIDFTKDYFGASRTDTVIPGPFATLTPGENRFIVWKRT